VHVLVADPIADAGLERLREAGHTVETAYDHTAQALRDDMGGVHALIVRSGTTVDAQLLEVADDLVVVARAGIGVDNIDIERATERGIVVANAPEGNVRAAAEHTVAMMFATARQIPQGDTRLRDGEWAKGDLLGTELGGHTLGIVGLGRVGQQVARRLGSLGMDLVAYDPYVGTERAEQLGVELLSLEECLDRADFATVHTPLTAETENLLSTPEFERLDGGYLVNCARGGVVDEAALATAVDDGILRGAALDVFETEPLPSDSPLLDHPEVVVTPHIGASTRSAQETVASTAAEQVIAALAGTPVPNALNAPSMAEHDFERLQPFVSLAEIAGRVATQLRDARVEAVTVTYEGELADEDHDLMTASALQGALAPLEWTVNAVNAMRIAEQRGVTVTESVSRDVETFRSLLTVTVSGPDHEVSVGGTLFGDDEHRLVHVDGYRVDAVPSEHMLVTRNRDEPGVIGAVGTILGDHEVNIAGMFNARETIGGEALTVYSLDDPIDETVRAALMADDRVTEVTSVSLPN
jgi:D-3-phosphoglycerate dehydrogenase